MLAIVEVLLGKSMVGVAIAGAVIVDLAAGYAGARWDLGAPLLPAAAARRIPAGLGLALIVAAAGIAVSLATGWARASLGHPSVTLFLALLRAAGTGIRDEMLYRGIPLHACERAGVRAQHARIFAALAGAAPLVLAPGTSIAAILLTACLGFLFATLWQRDRSGYSAAAAHGGYLLIVRSLAQGELFDLDWATGSLSPGARAAGPPAFAMAIVTIGIALFLVPRLRTFGPPEAAPAPVDEGA